MAEPSDEAKKALGIIKNGKGGGASTEPSQEAMDAISSMDKKQTPSPPPLPGQRRFTHPKEGFQGHTNPFVTGDFSLKNIFGVGGGDIVRAIRQGKPSVMAGSMAGFEAGSRIPGPMKAPAALVGGTLGAAGGYFASEFGDDIARWFSPKVGEVIGPEPSVQQRMNEAGEVILNDMTYGGGAQIAGPLLRGGVRLAGGLTQSGLDLAKNARQVGINLSIADVTESTVIPWITTIFGKFPLIAGPITRHAKELGKGVHDAVDRLFITMAPLSNMGAMGRRVDKIADAHFRLFRSHFNKRYEELFTLARQLGGEVPSSGAVRVADDYAELLQRKMSAVAWADHPFGKWYRSEIGQKLTSGGLPMAPLEGAIVSTGPVRYREFMSVDRHVGLIESLARVVQDNPGHNWKEIMEPFKNAMDKSVLGITTPVRNKTTGKVENLYSKRLSEMWSKIDTEYSAVLREIFETRVAKSLNRISGNRWANKVTKENSRPPELTVNILTENNTKSNWQSMAKLIPGDLGAPGKKIGRMAGIVGQWLNKGFQRAREYDVAAEQGISVLSKERGDFSLKTWFKHTGMDDPNSIAYEGTREAIKHSNIGWSNFVAFNDALVAAVRSNVPNVSSFIARKVNISGISAIRSMVLPGAAAAGGAGAGMVGQGDLMTAAAVVTIGNMFAHFVGNPKWVKMASQAADTSLQIHRRRAAILGLVQMQEDEGGPDSIELGVPALPSGVKKAAQKIPEQEFKTGEAAEWLWEGIKSVAKEASTLTKSTLKELLN